MKALLPHPQVPVLVTTPPNLTFVDFLQTMLVAFSNLPQTLVRPEWQKEQPKNPPVETDWIAFGYNGIKSDANAYLAPPDNTGNSKMQRQETVVVQISVYGPNSADNVTLVRDGFEIPPNLAALRAADVGFVDISNARRVPDRFNQLWIDRWITELTLHRYISRTYPITSFQSATGTVYSQTAGNPNNQTNWQTGS